MKKFLGYVLAFTAVICLTFSIVYLLEPKHKIEGAGLTNCPNVVAICMDEELQPYAYMWQKEVGRRFSGNTLVLEFHAGSLDGKNFIGKVPNYDKSLMSVKEVVQHYQSIYIGWRVVCVCCNTNHLRLGIPGIWYSPSSCWVCPDRQVMSHQEAALMTLDGKNMAEEGVKVEDRSDKASEVVGNIYEFIQDQ